MTESQVLERIADKEKTSSVEHFWDGKNWKERKVFSEYLLDPNKLAALLAEMSNRIEQLENKPVDAVTPNGHVHESSRT